MLLEMQQEDDGSKVIVVPFDGNALYKYAEEQRAAVTETTQGIEPSADTGAMFWNTDHSLNTGANGYIQLQRKISDQYGLFGEGLTAEENKWEESKIGYLKFDISQYDLSEMGKATLSLLRSAKRQEDRDLAYAAEKAELTHHSYR